MKVQEQARRAWASLSKWERKVIRTKAKASPDAVVRSHSKIILSLVQGVQPREIARGSSCSVSQVYRVAHRFLDEGPAGLADKREDNGENKVDEVYIAVLLAVLEGSPRKHGYRRPTWTQELLILVLDKKTGTRISRTTMSRLLKRLKIRHGMPKPIVGCPWKKRRKTRRLNAIRRQLANLPKGDVAVYADEVDIHLNPKIGRDWMRRGTQKKVLTPGKNQKRYLAGAFDARTGEVSWVESDRKDSDLFIKFLWHLVKHVYPRARCIHIVLDNYRIHSSARTELALGALRGRVELHFLPPYCPDHNRIERVWKDLHDNVTRNHQCRTIAELMRDVDHYLRERNRKLQRNDKRKKRAA